jgi:hypothetical protein
MQARHSDDEPRKVIRVTTGGRPVRTWLVTVLVGAVAVLCLTANYPRAAHASTAPTAAQYDAGIAAAVSADVASSVKLPDGNFLWAFGDTTKVNGVSVSGADGYPHDSFAIQAPEQASFTMLAGPYGYGWQQVPNWSNGDYFWANGMVVDGSTLYVYGDQVSGLSVVGYAVAQFSVSDNSITYKTITLLTGAASEAWSSVVPVSGGYDLIGSRHTGASGCLSDCITGDVAFVPASDLATPADWTVTDAVFPSSLDLGNVISVTKSGSLYVAMTKRDDILGSAVEVLTSASLTSGWSVFATDSITPTAGCTETYSAELHPGEGAPTNEYLVSWANNGSSATGGSTCAYSPSFAYLSY